MKKPYNALSEALAPTLATDILDFDLSSMDCYQENACRVKQFMVFILLENTGALIINVVCYQSHKLIVWLLFAKLRSAICVMICSNMQR